MYFCGVDPGKEGAFVIINEDKEIVGFKKMPTIPFKKTTLQFDILGIVSFFKFTFSELSPLKVFIEQIHSAPGQGVVSAFSMGEGFGILKGVLASLTIPHSLVEPNVWKKELMAGLPKDKMASVVVASRLFPGCHDVLKKVKGAPDHNMADALLIAEWGRRHSS